MRYRSLSRNQLPVGLGASHQRCSRCDRVVYVPPRTNAPVPRIQYRIGNGIAMVAENRATMTPRARARGIPAARETRQKGGERALGIEKRSARGAARREHGGEKWKIDRWKHSLLQCICARPSIEAYGEARVTRCSFLTMVVQFSDRRGEGR